MEPRHDGSYHLRALGICDPFEEDLVVVLGAVRATLGNVESVVAFLFSFLVLFVVGLGLEVNVLRLG